MSAVDFPPPRQRGVTIHAALAAVLAAISGLGAWLASNQPIGLRFTVYIAVAALAFIPLPVLAYRLWALNHARYMLDRDSLSITWGLRLERIPISDLEWVRPLGSLPSRPSLPPLWLPGSLLGWRRTADLGLVEFLASEVDQLLLLATRHKIIAISPHDPQAFLLNIQRAIEMGSLSPAQPQSVYPAVVISDAWQDRLVRVIWLADVVLNAGLLTWVSLMIPTRARIPLGFLPNASAGEEVPAVGLILLPVISIFLSLVGWLAGLAIHRRPDQRILAGIIWGNSLLTTLLFLAAVVFILTTPTSQVSLP